MELPQPRPYGTEGRKATHDFLSLYSHSTVQQDPSPPSQGAYLRTHDFLQPLEGMGRATAKEESRTEVPSIEKPPPPTPPPSVGNILPGGIGTYTISHISCFNQRVPKPEGKIFTVAQASNTDRNDDNSNSSSYSGSGFALWQESSAKKGKTGKENTGERPIARDVVEKLGQWTPERPAQSSSNNQCNSFSSLSSSQPLGKKNQSFMDMIKSAKIISQDDEYMDDEEEFVLKKEASSTLKGELRVKVDGKSIDQKANTPRSKHSATEQRRRSKINDRFQMLRELIPNSDQKRDKASFLLEVIEYIQYLQEKVHKYDGSCQGWNPEPAKPMPWRNNERPAEAFIDQSRGLNSGSGPALAFAAKLDEKNITLSPNILGSAQNTVESDISTATTFTSMDHQPGLVNKAAPFPISVRPNIFAPVRSGVAFPQFPPRAQSESDTLASQAQHQSCRTRSCTTDAAEAIDKMKEHDMSIEGGTISISSAYSQGLLNTLTQALQSSGVDLSQASISVQIELGKRASALASNVKGNDVLSRNQGVTRSRVTPGDGSDQALKKVKTSRS